MRVLLSALVEQHPGEVAKTPFRAINGHEVEVTAVLERTAVVHDGDVCYKRVVRLVDLTVEEEAVRFFAGPMTKRFQSAARGRALSGEVPHRRQSGRRFNGSVVRQPNEQDVLREQGKIRCPRCREIKAREVCYANGYCKPCAKTYLRDRRARAKQEAR